MDEATPQVDLQRLASSLWRRRWIIALTTVAVVAGAVGAAILTDPIYESHAEVLIQPGVAGVHPEAVGRVVFDEQELRTQVRIATSEVVQQRAMERLGLSPGTAGTVHAVLIPDTRVLVIAARDGDPQRARDLSQAVAEEYVRFRRDEAMVALAAGRDRVVRQLETHRDELARLDAILEADEEPSPLIARERGDLSERITWLTLQLAAFDALHEDAIGGGQITKAAAVPGRPIEPTPLRDGFVAALLGLVLGTGLAMVRNLFDDATHTAEDAAEAIGRPVLAQIPRFKGAEKGIVVLRDPEGPGAEAFRDLRTNLRFVAPDLKVLSVTSPMEGEGKTTVAANLAAAAALAGFIVLIIDADLRRPALHRTFGVVNASGLTDVLVDTLSADEAMRRFDDPPLALLTAGSPPPNPNELLGSQRFADLVEKMTAQFDLVVIDTPPTLAVSDVQEVAALSDVTLVVAQESRTGRRALGDTRERLERAGVRIGGCVLNFVDPRHLPYGYYQYSRNR